MTIALWCVLLAALYPYVFVGLAKRSRRYDNRLPRNYEKDCEGWRQRAYWTHLNGIEAFAPFAAAVIIAHVVAGPQRAADVLAVAFILFRTGYGISYVADRPTLRSLLWILGFACVIGLFVVAA